MTKPGPAFSMWTAPKAEEASEPKVEVRALSANEVAEVRERVSKELSQAEIPYRDVHRLRRNENSTY